MQGWAISVCAVIAVAVTPLHGAAAQPPKIAGALSGPDQRADSGNVCLDTDVTAVLATSAPGDLLAPPQDVTLEVGLIEGRIYRVIYATSGPGGKPQAACTIVATPEDGGVSSFLVEGHGAWGLKQECQPSMNATNFVSSPDPETQGAGPLFSTVKSGGVFVAPDYPAAGVGGNRLQPVGHGVAQGVSMIDAARIVTRNPEAFGLAAIPPDAEIPLVLTGYSQGGGAALWAGQLASYYLEMQGDRSLDLAGVIAYEPGGTQLVASGQESRSLDGFHLADRFAYGSFSGTVYLSWIARSWSQITQADKGPLPFGPSSKIQLSSVLSKSGIETSKKTVQYCSASSSDLLQLGLAVAAYRNPDKARLLTRPFAGSKRGGSWKSAFDTTCARGSGVPKGARNICAWLQFNTVGPNGVNPYPKYARNNAGELVPIHLIHGRDDRTIWCVDDAGVVEPRNCLTAQFYDSIAPAYCQGEAYLHVDYMAGVGHGGVYWQSLTNRETGSWYFGSPFETFVSGALNGTLPKTCSINYLDPI